IDVDLYGPGWMRQQTPVGSVAVEAAPANEVEYLGRKIMRPGGATSYLSEVIKNLQTEGPLGGIARTWRQYQYRRETKRLDTVLATAARGPVKVTEQLRIFAQYEIILNCSNVWSDGRPGSVLIPHVRLRDFEAPMCRTCYLTGHTEEIAEFYEIGTEIDTYANETELQEKVRLYLKHPGKAEALREAGYRRALRDHTWENRFKELFRKIGLNK
ncbi:MAG: glycosyltransferase, partial [Verrucomicrobiota bacterium]|nr:glycosyltransferase [Verrucomicrobiota bacterium]